MNCQWFYKDTFEERFDVRRIWEEDILIVDEDTGIVYQGHQDEGTGDMQAEVEEFLRRG